MCGGAVGMGGTGRVKMCFQKKKAWYDVAFLKANTTQQSIYHLLYRVSKANSYFITWLHSMLIYKLFCEFCDPRILGIMVLNSHHNVVRPSDPHPERKWGSPKRVRIPRELKGWGRCYSEQPEQAAFNQACVRMTQMFSKHTGCTPLLKGDQTIRRWRLPGGCGCPSLPTHTPQVLYTL